MTSESADEDVRRRAHAESFDSAADAYERGRPSYPRSAIEWLLPSGARTAVDLGAGTGQLTEELVSDPSTHHAISGRPG